MRSSSRVRRPLATTLAALAAGMTLALAAPAGSSAAARAGSTTAAAPVAVAAPVAAKPKPGPTRLHTYLDPLAASELEWRRQFRNTWGVNGSVNVQTSWFDVTKLPAGSGWEKLLFKNENYWGRELKYAGNEALFQRLGLQPDRVLLEVLTRNLPDDEEHSEEYLVRSLQALQQRIPGLDLFSLWVALNSSRIPCAGKCSALIPAQVAVSYLVPWGTRKERLASAPAIEQLVNLGIYTQNEQAKAAAQVKAAMQPPCAPAGTGGDAPGDARENAPSNAPGNAPGNAPANAPGNALGNAPGGNAPGGKAPGGNAPAPGFRMDVGAPRRLALPFLAAAATCATADAAASGLAAVLAKPLARDLGGIDFSTMELRYLADLPGDDGRRSVRYAFSATGDGADSALGAQVLRESTNDFLTWLAIPPERFWVNLNPTEPNRVIDPVLGRTQAGKALLEADFLMKKADSKLTHPDTALGKRYWDSLRADAGGQVCVSSRTWVVPGKVTVHESGDEFHILDAKLKLLTETAHLKAKPDSGIRTCPAGDPATEEHNQRAYESMVLPDLEKAVNTAPEFAPLRRAYLGRVAAEWIRQRHAKGIATSYDAVIDSNDVSRWRLTDGWKPEQTFAAFVTSHREGDYTVTRRERQGNAIYERTFVTGGVDFSRIPLDRVDNAAFGKLAPGRTELAKGAVSEPRASGDQLWLGGETAVTAATDSALTRFGRGMADRTGLVAVVAGGALVLLVGMGFLKPRRRPEGEA